MGLLGGGGLYNILVVLSKLPQWMNKIFILQTPLVRNPSGKYPWINTNTSSLFLKGAQLLNQRKK